MRAPGALRSDGRSFKRADRNDEQLHPGGFGCELRSFGREMHLAVVHYTECISRAGVEFTRSQIMEVYFGSSITSYSIAT
jgi:hypothetical protein